MLQDIIVKIERAHEHLELFNKETRHFLKRRPYRLDSDLEVKGESEYELTVTMRIDRYPPPRLSVIAGDIVYQIRTALDHLVYQLGVIHVGVDGNFDRTEFPIFLEEGKFFALNKGQPKRGSGLEKMRNVETTAQAIIEGLQPYHSGANAPLHPLWILQELCNIDKHRRLYILGGPIGDISIDPAGTFMWKERDEFMHRPLKNGAVIFRATIVPQPTFPGIVTVDQKIPPHIVFEEAIPLPERYVGEVLEDILRFVEHDVIPQFAK